MDTPQFEMTMHKARLYFWNEALVIVYPTPAIYAANTVAQLLPPEMKPASANGEYHIGMMVDVDDGQMLMFATPDHKQDYQTGRMVIMSVQKFFGPSFQLAIVQSCTQAEFEAVREFSTKNHATLVATGAAAFNIFADQTVSPNTSKH